MPMYNAVVIEADGVVDLKISASSLEDANTTASARGHVVSLGRQWDLGGRGLTPLEREALLSKLASLLEARVGTGQALRLIRDEFDGRVRQVADDMLQQIEAGASIAEAMKALGPQNFPPALVALAQAGFHAGDSVKALESACEFETEMQALQQVSGKGLMSAGIGFLSALGVLLASTFWIGPTVTTSMSAMTKGSSDMGWAFTLGYATTIVLLLLGLVLGGLTLISTVGRRVNPESADKLTSAIPIWGLMRLGKERFLGLHSLSALIKAGLTVEQALSITASSLPQGRLGRQTAAAAEAVASGQNWTSAFVDLPSTDRAALSSSSDRTQTVAVLARMAQTNRRGFQLATEAFVTGLQLISAISLTIGGGLLFAMSILPMLQTASRIL